MATINILKCLAAAPNGLHGYALMQSSGLASGTLYPILKRLSDRGWSEKNWESGEDVTGPPRRIYRLTALGRKQLEAATHHNSVQMTAGAKEASL